MTDFPPNLEDGELCLPSDIFEEIFRIEAEKITQNLAIEINSFDNEGKKAGVFIPQTVPKLKERKGTGVFLPSKVTYALIATPTNQTSGKKEEVIGGVNILVENQPAKRKPFQPSKRRNHPKTKWTSKSK